MEFKCIQTSPSVCAQGDDTEFLVSSFRLESLLHSVSLYGGKRWNISLCSHL